LNTLNAALEAARGFEDAGCEPGPYLTAEVFREKRRLRVPI
jgi:hypothetical protein